MFGLKALNFDGARVHRQHDGLGQQHTTRPPLSGLASGLVAGSTRVATDIGWRPVEAVAIGDRVLTFDHGLQVVRKITRGVLWNDAHSCPRHLWPLMVPSGALGNQGPMMLLPEQVVMIESDASEEVLGDPFALLTANALDGVMGVERELPDQRVEVITLHFDRDEVVFANIGALFFCPARAEGDLVADLFAEPAAEQMYEPLPLEQARTLALMIEMDQAEATRARA